MDYLWVRLWGKLGLLGLCWAELLCIFYCCSVHLYICTNRLLMAKHHQM